MIQTLHRRLLFSHLGVMVAIVGTYSVSVYQFVSYNLYQKLDYELVRLASAAAHKLPEIKANRAAIYPQPQQIADNDGDLDIPWQHLREVRQSIEWFDAEHQLLAKAGKQIPNLPLVEKDFYISEHNQIRSLFIPVYPPGWDDHKQTKAQQKNPPKNNSEIPCDGYIRVSEATIGIEQELSDLRWGLMQGGLVALAIGGFGSWWLTRQYRLQIEQSFQRLKQFTADASHELRSLLTVIQTSIQVMQSHPERTHPADVKKLAAIASATQQMTRLIEDLLFLARTDAIAKTPSREWLAIELDEVLEDLVNQFEPLAQAKKITLKSYLLDGIVVEGDASQLKRLFTTLLENALRYTPYGGTVAVSLINFGKFAVIKVKDTGIGIAPEHRNLIFERFWRFEIARLHYEEGLGLGLAIAKAIAQSHGGEIIVTSQVGIGSCFQVCLPLASHSVSQSS